MANKDFPRGLWPIRHLTGGEIRSREYTVTTGSTVYTGDLLKAVNGGTVEPSAANDGIIVVGVAAHYVDDSASAGGKKVQVYDDPYIVFGAQADSGTATTSADVFETANHVAGSGSSTSYLSGHELDASDIATGAQLKIIGLVDAQGNAWGEHSDVEVLINEHLYKAAVAGVNIKVEDNNHGRPDLQEKLLPGQHTVPPLLQFQIVIHQTYSPEEECGKYEADNRR